MGTCAWVMLLVGLRQELLKQTILVAIVLKRRGSWINKTPAFYQKK